MGKRRYFLSLEEHEAFEEFTRILENTINEYSEIAKEMLRNGDPNYKDQIKKIENLRKQLLKNQNRLPEVQTISKKNLNVAGIGATVTVKSDEYGEEDYTLVDRDPNYEDGYITNTSPIGEALIGKKVGDNFSVKTPSGDYTGLITEIAYINKDSVVKKEKIKK